MLWNQLRSPLLLLLLFAAGASVVTGEWVDAAIVARDRAGERRRSATRASTARSRPPRHCAPGCRSRASVLRDGARQPVPLHEVVPGDVVLLSAGSLVPADAVLLEATDFFVSEAVLTGESFPVRKQPGHRSAADALARTRAPTACFLGTNVRSGTARCLVVAHRRPATEFGAIARPADAASARDRVRSRHPPLRLPALAPCACS